MSSRDSSDRAERADAAAGEAAADDLVSRQMRADMNALAALSRGALPTPRAVLDGAEASASPSRQPTESNTMKNPSKSWLRVAVAAAVLAFSGVVFAATQTSIFSIWVDTDGKTEQQVEDEIADQLEHDGIADPEVRYTSDEQGSRLEIEGARGERRFQLIRAELGDEGGGGVIEMEPPALDVEREPGMSDEELADKVRAQLAALGMDGEVEVSSEPCDEGAGCEDGVRTQVQIRAEQQLED